MRASAGWAGLLAGAVLVAGCASAPAQPRAVDPVGVFDFSTAVEGQAVTGTLEISRSNDVLGGTLSTSVTEPIPVRAVTVEGQQMTVLADTPDGPVSMILTFAGNEFTGSWTYAGMSGTLTGVRRRT